MVDFDDLSVIGFLGVILWVAFVLSIFLKPVWYTDFYNRFPRMDVFNEFIYGMERIIPFMIARFIVIALIVYTIGKLITLI